MSVPGNSSPLNLKETLRERYQARNRKSCLPCRERKVRCNRQQPCLTCTRRGHADLCFYPDVPPQRGLSVEAPPREAINPGIQDTPQSSRARPSEHEITTSSTPSSSLLGNRSMIAMARESNLRQGHNITDRQEAFETGMFPLLGIEAQTTESHSFTARNSSQPTSSPTMPSDQEMVHLFGSYKSLVYPYQPIFYDLDHIEKVMCSLLGDEGESKSPGTQFLCLFHAILASGAQFCDLPAEQRVRTTQKHVKHALNLLGTFEFLWNPTKEIIQALIVLVHVLQNDANPRAAWVLSGIAVRSALSLGIHKSGPKSVESDLSSEEARNLRTAIVWQDALFSMAFGRTPTAQEMDHESDLPPILPSDASEPRLTYREAMIWLSHVSMRFSSSRFAAPGIEGYNEIFSIIDTVQNSCEKHIREREECRTMNEVNEHYSFRLHKNFGISSFCRAILSSQGRHGLSDVEASSVLDRVLDALKEGAKAFVSIQSISNHASRSWAFLHNGLCSSLLLGFIDQTKDTEETRDIQTKLIQSLEGSEDLAGNSRRESLSGLSNAQQKALKALKAQRKLAEEVGDRRGPNEIYSGHQAGETVVNPSAAFLPEGSTFQQDMLDPTIFGSIEMDDWIRCIDFGSYSPLDAYDFLMSEQFAPA